MGGYSKTKTGAAVTSTSRASPGTIKNETGKNCVITAIETMAYPTLESAVNSGGLVELENGSVDIVPCKYYVGGVTALTVGGVQLKPEMMKVHLPFPSNSTVTIYYTPQDNQSQKLNVTLHFAPISYSKAKHTWIDSAVGSAVSATTEAVDHVTYDVPAQKGGILKTIRTIVFGTIESIVNSGGLLKVKNIGASPSWEPLEYHVIGVTCVGCGGAVLEPHVKPVLLHLPEVSKIQVSYTPQDDQSQLLAMTFMWTKS